MQCCYTPKISSTGVNYLHLLEDVRPAITDDGGSRIPGHLGEASRYFRTGQDPVFVVLASTLVRRRIVIYSYQTRIQILRQINTSLF